MSRDPRDEAERLVAAALAALSVAANGTAGFATGSAECCVCPVCKAIAKARDPDPEFAERLASGVGDLATGLAGVLRAFGAQAAGRTGEKSGPVEDDVWKTATSETTPVPPAKPMAKKAVKKVDPDA